MSSLLPSAAMQQDYVLFLTFLTWSGVAALWWRFARSSPSWDWLPWSAGAGILAAALELFNFTHPVTPLPLVPSYLLTDRLHGALTGLMLAGWFLSGRKSWTGTNLAVRALTAVCLCGVAAARWLDPEPAMGGLWLALAGTACLAARPGLARGFSVVALWLSCAGPVAEAVSRSRRWTDTSEWGLLWTVAQLVAALVALVLLVRDRQILAASDEERRDGKPILIACGIWLIAGLGLAAWMGRLARTGFESGMLRRVETAAAVLNRDVAEAALGPEFRLRGIYERKRENGAVTRHAYVKQLAEPVGLAFRRELGRIERANYDINFIRFSTLRDGWVVEITSDRQRKSSPEGVGLSGRVTVEYRLAWETKTARYLTPHATDRGLVTFAQAPLLNAKGAMLGWLTFELSTAAWSLSQGQARLLVFVIVTLGLVLAVLVLLQRRRVRERESARAAANAAAAADHLKTAFLAKVSHELRTPIQSILGYSELLRGVMADHTGRTRLAALRQHGELMLRLVNDLLDLSAIQAGAFRLNEKPVSFAELVRQTVDSLRSRADAKQLQLRFHLAPGVPPWARVDGERVRQVVLNLVGNAIKFTDAGWVDVKLAPGHGLEDVCLIVSDTGPGISPAERSRLFQPFSRLEATASKEGTGLGLSLAAALCRSMQGTLTVESHADGGACFTATFRVPACVPQTTAEHARTGTLLGRKILVAEDNALVRELFGAFLHDEGAVCVAVADGEAALAAAQREIFDAVVLDLGMPRIDGLETARRLRVQAPPGLRIVGVSAHAGEQERSRALAAGMDAFLTKPVELSALAAALESNGLMRKVVESEDLMARLVAQFRTEAAAQGAAVATALAEQDWAALLAAAHYLKNSAAIVRDDPLFETCCALERSATSHDLTSARLRWAECERELQPWIGRETLAGEISSAPQRNRQSAQPTHGQ